MAFQKQNVIIGAAQFWIAAAGTALPDFVAAEPYGDTLAAVAAGAWRNVGYTTDGLTLSYEPTYTDVEADQSLDSVRTFKSGMRVTLATTMLEATLENLALAWGQTAPAAAVPTGDPTTGVIQEIDIEQGALGDAPLERVIVAIGNGLEGANGFNERTYAVTRAIQTETSAFSATRTAALSVPATFRLLPGDSGAPYGTITDRLRQSGW